MPPRLFTHAHDCGHPDYRGLDRNVRHTLGSSTARRMELTVESRSQSNLCADPWIPRRPKRENLPALRHFSDHHAGFCAADIQPYDYLSFLLNAMLLPALPGFRDRYPRAGVGIQDHCRDTAIDGPHMACIRLPLRKIFDQHAIFSGKIPAAK